MYKVTIRVWTLPLHFTRDTKLADYYLYDEAVGRAPTALEVLYTSNWHFDLVFKGVPPPKRAFAESRLASASD